MEHPGLSTLAIKHEELRLKFAGSLVVSEFRDWLPGRTQGSITDRVTHKPNCLEAILYLYCANCYNTDLSLKQLWKKKWLNKIFNYCTNGFDSVATSHVKWTRRHRRQFSVKFYNLQIERWYWHWHACRRRIKLHADWTKGTVGFSCEHGKTGTAQVNVNCLTKQHDHNSNG